MNVYDRLSPIKTRTSSKRILAGEDSYFSDKKINFSFDSKVKNIGPKVQLIDECKNCDCFENLTASNNQSIRALKETHALIIEIAESLNQREDLNIKITPQELALDLATVSKGRGKARAQEAEHLRTLVLGLNEKLKVFQLIDSRLEEFKRQSENAIKQREKLKQTIDETTTDIENTRSQQDVFIENLKAERDKSVDALMDQHLRYKEKCEIEDKLNCELNITRAELDKIKSEGRNFDKMQDMIDGFKQRITEEEKKRKDLRNLYSSAIQNFDLRSQEAEKELTKLIRENRDLLNEMNEIKYERNNLNTQNENKLNQILNLQAEKEGNLADIKALDNKAKKSEQMEKLAKKFQEQSADLNEKIKESTEKFGASIESLNREKKDLMTKNKNFAIEINSLKLKIKDQDKLLHDSDIGLKELSGQLRIVEQKIFHQTNTQKLKEDLGQTLKSTTKIHDNLCKDLDSMSQSYITNSHTVLSQQRTLSKLSSIISDKDAEIEDLQELVVELKKAIPVYIPFKNDPIDSAMADYINTRDKALDVPFVREEEGLYLFGTKRVFIKLENGKLIRKFYFS